NEDRADLAIFVLRDTTNQEWHHLETEYSSARQGNFVVRGLTPEARKYAVYIRDRWNNKSDTLELELTPLYEELIPFNRMRLMKLEGDSWEGQPKYVIERLFNGIYNVREDWFKSVNIEYPQ